MLIFVSDGKVSELCIHLYYIFIQRIKKTIKSSLSKYLKHILRIWQLNLWPKIAKCKIEEGNRTNSTVYGGSSVTDK